MLRAVILDTLLKKGWLLVFGVLFLPVAYAFPCFITVIKDSCWTDYDVTISIINTVPSHVIKKINIPVGIPWGRTSFDCSPNQVLDFKAEFTPAFWSSEAGKIYPAVRYWILPENITADVTAWSITVCYPEEFSEVPLPPTATGVCRCNKNSVPSVNPQ